MTTKIEVARYKRDPYKDGFSLNSLTQEIQLRTEIRNEDVMTVMQDWQPPNC